MSETREKRFDLTNPSSTTRREFLQDAMAIAGVAAASSLVGTATMEAAAQTTGTKRPNLVFFLGEGHRADALSLEKHPFLKTPNHDRIGAEGGRFENAFCTNALCAPARAALMTGQYSRTTGALSNKLIHVPLDPQIPLFTDLLHQAGYDVAIVGKTHIRNGAEERYWDYYFGHNAATNDYVNPFFKEGRKGVIGEEKRYQNVWPDDLATDRALSWLQEDRGDRPFCLLVWWVSPHEPFFRPRRKFDRFDDGTRIPKPSTFDDDLKGWPGKPKSFVDAGNKIGTTTEHLAAGSLEGMAKDYYAGLEGVDDNVGRIMHYLESKNILNDTAIIHGSDHGYFLGEWRLFDKRLMHEPSIRVPLLIRYPKRIPAGSISKDMVLDIDIAPTVLDLAGISPPEAMQGKSILPLLKDRSASARKEWFYEYFEWPNPEKVAPHKGIRTETHKLIVYTQNDQEHELYDLKADPMETQNLWGRPESSTVQQDLLDRMTELSAKIPIRSGAGVG
jgi:arylsulfatase A-like enzyme